MWKIYTHLSPVTSYFNFISLFVIFWVIWYNSFFPTKKEVFTDYLFDFILFIKQIGLSNSQNVGSQLSNSFIQASNEYGEKPTGFQRTKSAQVRLHHTFCIIIFFLFQTMVLQLIGIISITICQCIKPVKLIH